MSTLRCNTIQDTAGVERYLARAWVNFNGTGTVAIRAAGNVSSITDAGTGTYVVNFTTAITDANYVAVATAEGTGGAAMRVATASQYAAGSVVIRTATLAQVQEDNATISVAIFR